MRVGLLAEYNSLVHRARVAFRANANRQGYSATIEALHRSFSQIREGFHPDIQDIVRARSHEQRLKVVY